MTYALIINGAVVQYPYSFAQLRRDHPDVSFPSAPSDEVLAGFGVVKVHPSDQPTHDAITQNVVQATPVLVNNQWVQGWEIEGATAEQIAARQLRANDVATHREVREDSFVSSFIAMSPAQVNSYIDNNTSNLAATRALLKKMAIMLLILVRREFRHDE